MKTIFKPALLLLALLLLTSCAAPQKRQALTMQNRAAIKSDRVLVNTAQREIGIHQKAALNSELDSVYSSMDKGAIVRHQAGYGHVRYYSSGVLDYRRTILSDLIFSAIKHHNAKDSIKLASTARSALNGFDYLN